MRFEEYKLFRETVTHFDKILMSLRRNAIYFSFTIFAAAVAAISYKIPGDVPFALKTFDLPIVLVIIELLVILSFLYLEDHYRYYLLKIAEAATEYEKELELGVKLEGCANYRDDANCSKLASISKCLKCLHDNGMEYHIRTAHFNIYALLLALGFVALNVLIFIRIGLSFNDFFLSLIVILLIALGSPILYTSLNIKNQGKNYGFDNNSLSYILSIFFFMLLTYLFYFFIFRADNNIRFSMINIIISSFNLSYFGALLISVVIFLVLGFRNKISKVLPCELGAGRA